MNDFQKRRERNELINAVQDRMGLLGWSEGVLVDSVVRVILEGQHHETTTFNDKVAAICAMVDIARCIAQGRSWKLEVEKT